MSKRDNTSVPKFGSFKPKAKPQADTGAVIEEDLTRTASIHHATNKRPSHPSDGLVSSKANHLSTQPGSETNKSNVRRLEQGANPGGESKAHCEVKIDDAKVSDLFIVDKRGDRKNIEFGSLHRSDIPAYRSTGGGRILGLSPEFLLDRDASSDKEVTLRHIRTSDRDRVKRPLLSRPRKDDHRPQLIRPEVNTSFFEENGDFLDLTSGLNIMPASEERENNDITPDYRTIGLSNTKQSHDLKNQKSKFDGSNGTDRAEREVQKQCAETSRKVKEDPSNIALWLDLIELQAKIVHLGLDESMFSGTETTTLAELRTGICEQALSLVRRDAPGRQQIILRMQHERSKIWEKPKLLKAWDSFLQEYPQSATLWMRYLDDKLSTALSFSFESCKRENLRCLRQLQVTEPSNSLNSIELGRSQIYALLRLTALIRDTGYEEHANAIWQAVLEKNFSRPPVSTTVGNIESFQAFWESDIPRIGEQNAKGWAHFVANGVAEHKRSSLSFADERASVVDVHAGIGSFGMEESKVSSSFHLPASADEEEQSEDPFREVMFSDLEDVLVCLSDGLPSENLVDAFLSFMGLPSRSSSPTDICDWRNDPHIRNHMPNFEGLMNHPRKVLTSNSIVTTLSLFTGAFKNSDLQVCARETAVYARLRFIDRVLESLSLIEQAHESLGEYWIAFKLYAFPGEALKCSKRLLKKWPSSLRLYNAFALAQVGIEQFEKAFEVWSAAIQLSSALPQNKQDDAIYIWHSLISSYVRNNKLEDALQCLLSITEGILPGKNSVKQSSSTKLKTMQHLQEQVETMLFRNKHIHAVLYAECAALLTYLSESLALVPALGVYATFETRLKGRENAFMLELLHQAKAGLVSIHLGKKGSYKPVLLRDCLSRSIELFPENSVFLDLYCRIGDQTRLDDRLRSALHCPLSHDASKLGLVGCSAAIAQELYRYRASASGSSAESVRSIFTRVLHSPTSKAAHSSFLWAAWLHFECHQITAVYRRREDADRADRWNRARRVFLDGVRCLPWCKAWIINGMNIFGQNGGLQKQELKQLYDVAVEREMRIRVNLDTSEG